MSQTVIKVENLSKQYRLGMVGAGTLREDLVGLWYRIRGKEDPYMKIAESNDRSSKGTTDHVWALRDVNFEVQQGEVLGIIGKNGAGKSTLLKLLSRVTAPTTGTIKAKGRIASLLEVGTGFHPELTGKENIYLNGAIMGMKRAEITAKLDEIIDFAGVQRYVDTPVKRYSSGMYVRLAFAVAAHLEPEILIVDEVLAVGDAEFQKKAIGKMQDVSAGHGRTVLFVSHNMKAVKALCSKGIMLEHGTVVATGDTEDVVQAYLKSAGAETNKFSFDKEDVQHCDIVSFLSGRIVNSTPINTTDLIKVEVQVQCHLDLLFHTNLHLRSSTDDLIFIVSSNVIDGRKSMKYRIEFSVPCDLLNEIDYWFHFSLVRDKSVTFHVTDRSLLRFKVIRNSTDLNWFGTTPGLIHPKVSSRVFELGNSTT